MEIAFQNRPEDIHAISDYVVRETEDGKTVSLRYFLLRQVWTIMSTALIGALIWGSTGLWQDGLLMGLLILLTTEALLLLAARFKPLYYEGIRAYERQQKQLTAKDLQLFQLPVTLTIDDNWLEVRNSESLHRLRWRQVDRVALTSDFIFVLPGNGPVIAVPKRDFASEQKFIDFAEKLIALTKQNATDMLDKINGVSSPES